MRDVGGKTVGIVDHSHKQPLRLQHRGRGAAERGTRADRAPAGARDPQVLPVQGRRGWSATSSPATTPRAAAISTPIATTRPSARRTAASPCTINLNAEDYEGGDLSFPEFGTAPLPRPDRRRRRLLLLAAAQGRPVTAGQALRLPAVPLRRCRGAHARAENNARLGDNVGEYRGETANPTVAAKPTVAAQP